MAGRLRRCLLAGLAAASVLPGFLAPSASALSPTTTPTPSDPTPSASASAVVSSSPSLGSTSPALDHAAEPNVHITSVGEPLLKSGADLKVQAVISNPTKKPLLISSVSLLGQDWVPDTRSGVLQFLDGGSADLSQLSVHDSVGSIPAQQSITVDFTVPRAALAWSDSFQEWGPRGIEVEAILEDGSDLTDRTFVVVAPGVELTPMPTGVVIPVTKIPRSSPDTPLSPHFSRTPSRVRRKHPRRCLTPRPLTRQLPQNLPYLRQSRQPQRTLRRSSWRGTKFRE